MKKIYLFLLFCFSWLSACHQSVDATTAYNVAGTYQLIGYTTPTIGDANPTGTVSAIQVDEQHINLVVKGNSGTMKINYSYTNVSVVSSTQITSGEDIYTLLYKGRQIGVAGNDAISRYIDIYPSTSITIKGVEF